MAELPHHPVGDGTGEHAQPRTSRRTYLWWAAGAGLVVLMLVLHLAGIFGPGSH
ncbi:MAG: hypothetical protein ABI384_11010 [Allobranchiibius sp.]